MPAGITPISPIALNCPAVAIAATANANLDGTTGTYTTLLTAGAQDGARVDFIVFKATGTTTVGMLRIFVASKLIAEFPVAAVTPSSSTQSWGGGPESPAPGLWTPAGGRLELNPGEVLKVSTEKAEGFTAKPAGANY